MKIEVLYFDGCPHHLSTVERVKSVLQEEGFQPEVSQIRIADQSAAMALAFLGSPSVRVDGIDVEPDARCSRDFGITCRTYANAEQREGLPSSTLIRLAIREAAEKERG